MYQPSYPLGPAIECEHDWRVNPNMILTSNPPQQQLRCATCGAFSSRVISGYVMPSESIQDWPKA